MSEPPFLFAALALPPSSGKPPSERGQAGASFSLPGSNTSHLYNSSSGLLGLLVSVGAIAGLAFAQTYASLIVFIIAIGFGCAMFSPAALGFLSDIIPMHHQSTAMGFYGALGEDTGVIAGSALGGFV